MYLNATQRWLSFWYNRIAVYASYIVVVLTWNINKSLQVAFRGSYDCHYITYLWQHTSKTRIIHTEWKLLLNHISLLHIIWNEMAVATNSYSVFQPTGNIIKDSKMYLSLVANATIIFTP